MEYSQDTELCHLRSDPEPLCIYFHYTRHTKWMAKATIYTNEPLTNCSWPLVEKLPLHLLLENQ